MLRSGKLPSFLPSLDVGSNSLPGTVARARSASSNAMSAWMEDGKEGRDIHWFRDGGSAKKL